MGVQVPLLAPFINSQKHNNTSTETPQTCANISPGADSPSAPKDITSTLSEHNNNVFLRPDNATSMLTRTVSNNPGKRRVIPIGRAVNLNTIYPQDLTDLIHAWRDLPEAIKVGITAMVRAAGVNERQHKTKQRSERK